MYPIFMVLTLNRSLIRGHGVREVLLAREENERLRESVKQAKDEAGRAREEVRALNQTLAALDAAAQGARWLRAITITAMCPRDCV